MAFVVDAPEAVYVDTDEKATRLLERVQHWDMVGLDTETTGVDRMKDQVVYWSLANGEERYTLPRRMLYTFKRFLEDDSITWVVQNCNFDAAMLANAGIEHVNREGRPVGNRVDPMVMHALYKDDDLHHGLERIGKQLLGIPKYASYSQLFGKEDIWNIRPGHERFDDMVEYASWDAWLHYLCGKELIRRLKREETWFGDLWGYYQMLESPLHDVLHGMSRRGIFVDRAYLRPRSQEALDRMEAAIERLSVIAGRPINPGSPKQLQTLFYDELGMPIEFETSGGASGNRKGSTAGDVLKSWKERTHIELYKGKPISSRDRKKIEDRDIERFEIPRTAKELVDVILEFRKHSKLRGTYIEGVLDRLHEDSGWRVHGEFTQHVARTGRLCVAGDTVLETTKGDFQIQDLDLSRTPEPAILTHEGRLRPIKALFYKGREEMFEVTLANGSSIVCTMGHRFWTGDGWKSLQEVQVGDALWAHEPGVREGRPASRPDREAQIHDGAVGGVVPARGDRGGAGQVGSLRAVPRAGGADLGQLPEALPGEVRRRAAEGEAQELLQRHEGEHPRGDGAALRAAGRRPSEGDGGRRQEAGRHRQEVRGLGVPGACEPGALRDPEAARAAVPHAVRGCGDVGAPGRVRSRHHGVGEVLLRRPTRLLPEAVRVADGALRAGVVRQGPGEGARLLRGEGYGGAGPHLLVPQSVRDAAVEGAARGGGSPHPRVRARREAAGRLLLPRGHAVGRGGWGVPLDPARGAEGRGEGTHGGGAGVQGAEVRHLGGVERGRQGGGGDPGGAFRLCRVISIESVGVRGVWDIEVEEDHSYVAQGFVNHNSSKNPNLQNLPRAENDPYGIRAAFVPTMGGDEDDDWVMLCADYSQLEMMLAASNSGDEAMLEAIRSGKDLHCNTAALMFGLPYEDLKAAKDKKDAKQDLTAREKDLCHKRTAAKTIGFGVLYGEGPWKLAEQLKVSVPEAKNLQKLFFSAFPTLKDHIDEVEDICKGEAVAFTILGRRRRLDNAQNERSYAEKARALRQAFNFTVQGFASEIAKQAMIYCADDDELRELDCRMLIQVHDELLFECPPESRERAKELIRHHMERPFRELLEVKLDADVGEGMSWQDAK